MLEWTQIEVDGYEEVIEAKDSEVGLHCFVAIHRTTLGPALGGTRIYPYENREDALEDVLRLAKGMSYKSALAETGLGGGKSVILLDPHKKTEALLHAYAEVVNRLNGRYICAEDLGATPEDMVVVKQVTPYVCGLPTEDSSGDPSSYTAWGLYRGMQATAFELWRSPSLTGKKVAIQGIGAVGSKIAKILFWEGADLILSDIDEERLRRYAVRYGAETVSLDAYFEVECDILCPCAMGGVIREETISKMQCLAVAGSANNQLAKQSDGKRLFERNILYATDYIINSGGIINAASELDLGGYDPRTSRDKVNKIYDNLLLVFAKSGLDCKATNLIADEIAEQRFIDKIGHRKEAINWSLRKATGPAA